MSRVEMDQVGLHYLLYAEDGPVNRDLDRRANNVLIAQVTKCPVETGDLRSTIHIEKGTAADGSPVRRIGTNSQHALPVEIGTGLYGPNRKKIVPRKPGGVLHWKDASGTHHFARSVKGQRAQPFIRPSLQAAKD